MKWHGADFVSRVLNLVEASYYRETPASVKSKMELMQVEFANHEVRLAEQGRLRRESEQRRKELLSRGLRFRKGSWE